MWILESLLGLVSLVGLVAGLDCACNSEGMSVKCVSATKTCRHSFCYKTVENGREQLGCSAKGNVAYMRFNQDGSWSLQSFCNNGPRCNEAMRLARPTECSWETKAVANLTCRCGSLNVTTGMLESGDGADGCHEGRCTTNGRCLFRAVAGGVTLSCEDVDPQPERLVDASWYTEGAAFTLFSCKNAHLCNDLDWTTPFNFSSCPARVPEGSNPGNKKPGSGSAVDGNHQGTPTPQPVSGGALGILAQPTALTSFLAAMASVLALAKAR